MKRKKRRTMKKKKLAAGKGNHQPTSAASSSWLRRKPQDLPACIPIAAVWTERKTNLKGRQTEEEVART
jgi:hypothetical protein